MSSDNITLTLYAPNGAALQIPVSAQRWQAEMRQWLEQGLSPVPPGEYERERRHRVGRFVIREHTNADGTTTLVVDVYFRLPNGFVHQLRSMGVYLNTPQDEQKFERAFGVSLSELPVYDGDTPLRLKGLKESRRKFVQTPRRPVWVVWLLNPATAQEPEDSKTKKRLFLRWETSQTASSRHQQQPGKKAAKKAGRARGDRKYDRSNVAIVDAVAQVWKVTSEEAARHLLTQIGAGVKMTVPEAVQWAREHPLESGQNEGDATGAKKSEAAAPGEDESNEALA